MIPYLVPISTISLIIFSSKLSWTILKKYVPNIPNLFSSFVSVNAYSGNKSTSCLKMLSEWGLALSVLSPFEKQFARIHRDSRRVPAFRCLPFALAALHLPLCCNVVEIPIHREALPSDFSSIED